MGLLTEDWPSDAAVRAAMMPRSVDQPTLDLPDGWRSEKLEFDHTEQIKVNHWKRKTHTWLTEPTPEMAEPVELTISLPLWLVDEYEKISESNDLEIDQTMGDALTLVLGDSQYRMARWLIRARIKMLTGRFT
jgi:hypothetical protein